MTSENSQKNEDGTTKEPSEVDKRIAGIESTYQKQIAGINKGHTEAIGKLETDFSGQLQTLQESVTRLTGELEDAKTSGDDEGVRAARKELRDQKAEMNKTFADQKRELDKIKRDLAGEKAEIEATAKENFISALNKEYGIPVEDLAEITDPNEMQMLALKFALKTAKANGGDSRTHDTGDAQGGGKKVADMTDEEVREVAGSVQGGKKVNFG